MAAYIEHLLHAYGYAAIFAIIALENVGLLLPGETILITSGIFAATTHELNVVGIVLAAAVAAFGGSVAGFMIGRYSERHFLHRLSMTAICASAAISFNDSEEGSSSSHASSRFFVRWRGCSRAPTRCR